MLLPPSGGSLTATPALLSACLCVPAHPDTRLSSVSAANRIRRSSRCCGAAPGRWGSGRNLRLVSLTRQHTSQTWSLGASRTHRRPRGEEVQQVLV